MNTRPFHSKDASRDLRVSEIGLGTWQLGGFDWGDISHERALETLNAAADAGITFIDTADVYGMGRSEKLIGEFLAQRSDRDRFFVATKLCRRPDPGWPQNFTLDTLRRHTEDSLEHLGVDALDLTQTHCIPHDVMKDGKVYEHLRTLQDEGLIRRFGASVESMDEALTCLDIEGMSSLQIIFNIFRQKPIDVLFEKAKAKNVALIIRLPVASGLLSGKMTRDRKFPANDHRGFNENGEHFNVGETFAGLGLAKGVELAEALAPLVPAGMSMIQLALRWCLDFDAVTTVIPGATSPEQARENASAAALPPLPESLHATLRQFYRDRVSAHIRGPY